MKIEINSSCDPAIQQELISATQVAMPLLPEIPVGEVVEVQTQQHIINSQQGPEFEFERTPSGARVCDASKGFITRALTCEARIDIR